MKRLKDRHLKKKEKKRDPTIRYKVLLKLGVKDTKENKKRWLDGEALNLITEAIEIEEIEIRHDSITNKIDAIFLKEQEQSEEAFLEKYYEDISNG